MRPSLRFLALVAIGWAGVRAWSLGMIPAGSLRIVEPSEARTAPPIVPTEFPPIEPPPAAEAAAPPMPGYSYPYGMQGPPMAPAQMRPVAVPVYYYGASSARVPLSQPAPEPIAGALPPPRRSIYTQTSALDEWPLSRLASMSLAQQRSSVVVAGQSTPVLPGRGIDRFQVSAWAIVRNQQAAAGAPASLSNAGTLGGSQTGARLLYNFTRRIAASLRTSSNLGTRGLEVAGGVRVQPLVSVPVWVTAERRQSIGPYPGRNAFAIFAEGGLYQRPLPWGFDLDAYLQAGVVGLRSRDAFVDGGAAFTRHVYKNISAGFGVWGAAQPGLYRVDAGPRVTVGVRKNVRVHLDYRQRLVGNAIPQSGPAISLGADF